MTDPLTDAPERALDFDGLCVPADEPHRQPSESPTRRHLRMRTIEHTHATPSPARTPAVPMPGRLSHRQLTTIETGSSAPQQTEDTE